MILRKRTEVQICRRFVSLHQEGVEIFEFCKKHITGELILFVASEVSAPCSHGNRFDPGGSWGTAAGVWGGHLAGLQPRQRGMPSTDRNLPKIFLKVFYRAIWEYKLFSPDFLRLGDIKLQS